MEIPSEIRFVELSVKEAFGKLQEGTREEQDLFRFIHQALDNLEQNAFCGIQIPKRQIPKEYVKRYQVKNLWKYDLPNAWRLIYSVQGGRPVVVSIVLEWMTHKEYNRRFKY